MGGQGRYFIAIQGQAQHDDCPLTNTVHSKDSFMQSAMTFESLKSNSKDKKVIVQ